ncbi:MAG: hypothetical protein IKE52_01100 [Mogibacterium sp.]|nr:hypothetical protein [Mogibacterium sp.]
MLEDKNMRQRIMMSVLGVLIHGVNVGILKAVALGVDPFQSLMSGIDAVIPIRFGTLYVIVNAILISISLIFDRSKIGLATVINLTIFGYIVEFSQSIVESIFSPMNMAVRLILLAIGLVFICFGSAIYFNANLGVSTYDAISLYISERQNRVSFKYCRVISDIICVTVAAILLRHAGQGWNEITGSIGIATIITAFFMGPLLSFFMRILPDPGHRA